MRSAKYILISVAVLFSVNKMLGCIPMSYLPKEYYMYRVYEYDTALDGSSYSSNDIVVKNCRYWQKLTSNTISIDDIYQAVYSSTIDDIERIYSELNGKKTGRNDCREYNSYNPDLDTNNKFIKWITQKDTSILRFLVLAKNNEYIRSVKNSKWYYPSMKINTRMPLEEIPELALAETDKRLRDRYLLQAVRAMFTLGRYGECIEIWRNEASLLPDNNCIKELIRPYIAGAEFWTGNIEKAMKSFAELGDVESLQLCTKRLSGRKLSKIEGLKLICEQNPNNQIIPQLLQKYVRELEASYISEHGGDFLWTESTLVDYNDLCNLCSDMAANPRCRDKAVWYYTGAFLKGLTGDTATASSLLKKAENVQSTKLIAGSVKVLRIYLDAKTSTYNQAYENKLLEQLKWLDAMIAGNINDNVIKNTSEIYKLKENISYYYWNDMLRKIVLGEICPRMLATGKTVRALQLANMADNRLFTLVDKLVSKNDKAVLGADGAVPNNRPQRGIPMENYRYSGSFNDIDYSNDFFVMADTLEVNSVVKYSQRVNKPADKFDKFLNDRGYTNSDYINDIIGTRFLRLIQYSNAVKYLSRVSDDYTSHLNVVAKFNPFSLKKSRLSDEERINFKYKFAKEMDLLERSFNSNINPDKKAVMMLKYVTGLRNSFERCWELTVYFFSNRNRFGNMEWDNEYSRMAMSRCREIIDSACKIASKEVAAEIQYQLCNYKFVAEHCPDTKEGILVRGKCDKLIDYHLESKREPDRWH